MNSKQKNIILSIIRTALIVLWVYAAVSKLQDYTLFIDQLKRQPLPAWWVHILVWALPLTELLIAVLLCFRNTLKSGLLLSSILLLAFTIYVGLGLLHVYAQVPCSCSGILGRMGWGGHLVFNVTFTVASITGFIYSHRGHKALYKENSGYKMPRLIKKNYE